ncbi:hypothetical protein [Aphanothece hegewaldii]|nr:hypothetical protein [Aphanothece hegewaldii]
MKRETIQARKIFQIFLWLFLAAGKNNLYGLVASADQAHNLKAAVKLK